MHQEQKAGSRVGCPGGCVDQCAYIVRIGVQRLRMGAIHQPQLRKGAGRKSLPGRSDKHRPQPQAFYSSCTAQLSPATCRSERVFYSPKEMT